MTYHFKIYMIQYKKIWEWQLVPFLFLFGFLVSCGGEPERNPKRRMYPEVLYPVKEDTLFSNGNCPFTFTMPNYLNFRKDSFFYGEVPQHDCWFDLYNDNLSASLHFSYFPIANRKNLDKLIEDAFRITQEHNVKAVGRSESLIKNEAGVEGIIFEVDGPVASPVQFFLTDSTRHFFRGSLYFNAKVNPDSTAPVLKFVRADVNKIISSFKWK
jgi:gliding motility-associated lipoprotein GldD